MAAGPSAVNSVNGAKHFGRRVDEDADSVEDATLHMVHSSTPSAAEPGDPAFIERVWRGARYIFKGSRASRAVNRGSNASAPNSRNRAARLRYSKVTGGKIAANGTRASRAESASSTLSPT